MFILPQRQQTTKQFLTNLAALFQLSFARLLPFALIIAILTDAPTISRVLWHHDILKSDSLIFAFALVESMMLALFFAFSLHQVWGLMHNRERAIDASSLFVGARLLRVVAFPVLFIILLLLYFAVSPTLKIVIINMVASVGGGALSGKLVLLLSILELLVVVYLFLRVLLTLALVVMKDASFVIALRQSWSISHGRMAQMSLFVLLVCLVTVPLHVLLLYLARVDNSVLDIAADLLVSGVMYILFNAAYALYFYDTQLPASSD